MRSATPMRNVTSMRDAGLFLALLGALLVTSCSTAITSGPPTLQSLRENAMARPDNLAGLKALAEAELLREGGDAARARAATEAALALAPRDLRMLFLDAVEAEVHGDLERSFDRYLEVIALASSSDESLAPHLAEVSLMALSAFDDTVDGYGQDIVQALTPRLAEPGRLGDEALHRLHALLMEQAHRRGDIERLGTLAEHAGCSTAWRISGPFGPRSLLGFDRILAPDADDSLAESYDLGPGRGQRATRAQRSRGCSTHLGGGPVGGPGTTFAESTLDLDEGGDWVLRLETPNAVQLFVDGRSIARLDRRRRALGRVSYHRIHLQAGEHLIRVRLQSRHPNPVVALSLSRTAGPVGGGEIEGRGPLTRYVRAQRYRSRGQLSEARQVLRADMVSEGGLPMLLSAAAIALNDPLRSAETRSDDARTLLGWARDRDPSAWYPVLALAQLEAMEGRDREALTALRDGESRWPRLLHFPLQEIDYLTRRQWHTQARAAIERARRLAPDACRPRRAALLQARREHRAQRELSLARELVACDARSDALMGVLLRSRRWEDAERELTRLVHVEQATSRVGEVSARLAIARARGGQSETADTETADTETADSADTEIEGLLQELAALMPQSEGPVTMRVDRLLAHGRAQEARTLLGGALAREPESMAEMRRVLRALDGESPILAHRRSGAEVIAEYEGSGRHYEHVSVLVLDYTVMRVFEDGSMMELTHNIFHVQSQQAVDALGEFEVPDGAQLLTLHTIKADGRRLEPDEIAGKTSLSLPNLAIGDYIEFEYVRTRGAPAGYPGGFIGDRFYFQNYDMPFDQSELRVIVPEDSPLSIDVRGDAPRVVEEIGEGLRVYRWRVQESRPLRAEPDAVGPQELFPSVYWGHGASWDQYVETMQDVLVDRDVIDPSAMRLVNQVLGSDAHRLTPEQRARLIYAWVLEHIENTPELFGQAPAMLAARRGNRSRVLRYLLELAGLDAQLALARSFSAAAQESELPDDESFRHVLVVVDDIPGRRFLHTGSRHMPFGALPANLNGQPALLLGVPGQAHAENRSGENLGRVILSPRGPDEDLRTVALDVHLRPDGTARMIIVETHRGASAMMWRQQLDAIAAANLREEFESDYVSAILPGARLEELSIEGREDTARPLILRYEVQVGALAVRSGDHFTVPTLFRANLGPQYASLAERSSPQLIATGLAVETQTRIHLPEGGVVLRLPEAGSLRGPSGMRMSAEAEARGQENETVVEVSRRVEIPRMRLPASQYGSLARFARGADDLEAQDLHFRLDDAQ